MLRLRGLVTYSFRSRIELCRDSVQINCLSISIGRSEPNIPHPQMHCKCKYLSLFVNLLCFMVRVNKPARVRRSERESERCVARIHLWKLSNQCIGNPFRRRKQTYSPIIHQSVDARAGVTGHLSVGRSIINQTASRPFNLLLLLVLAGDNKFIGVPRIVRTARTFLFVHIYIVCVLACPSA